MSSTTPHKRTGSCLCGEVRYEITGEVQPAIACHCRECRRQSGHHFAAAAVARDALTMTRDSHLKWFRASDFAARGFCGNCGSTLFWRRDESELINVLLGAMDTPTGTRIERHFWVSEKGDYYTIADGTPQVEEE